jgi:hypothetical protein
MAELLTESSLDHLVDLAARYARSKNLDAECYITSMIDPMIRDAEVLDLRQMVATLTRYHEEWLAKN